MVLTNLIATVCCFLAQNFAFRTHHLRNSTIELTLKVLQSACRTLAQARFFQQRASALLMKTYWKWQHSLRPVKRDHFFHWPLSQSPTKITFGSKKWVYLLAFRATNHSRYRNFLWCLSWRLDHQINGKFGIPVLLTIGTKLYIPSIRNTDLVHKMSKHGLNHGLFLSLFKLLPFPIHWILYVLAYLHFTFEF